MFYKKSGKSDRIICTLCNHYCKLKEGQVGVCGVNKNIGGQIECLVYGYPAALNIDPVEKKPLYHFLPQTKTLSFGTVGCNFSCSFCQNHGISQEKEIDKKKYYSPKEIVDIAIKNGCLSISYTYNEPTIFFPYIKDIAKIAKEKGLRNIMVSNGFESIEVIEEMEGVIDAINIDLKCYNHKYYKKMGGDLDKVLSNIILLQEKGIWVEITTLIIPELNDSPNELNTIASFISNHLEDTTPWHLSAFHPNYKMLDKERTPKQTLEMAYQIGKENNLKNVYIGNLGLENNTYCECGELLLQRVSYQTKIDKTILDGKCPKCKKEVPGIFIERKIPSVAGKFYSNVCKENIDQINNFNKLLQNSNFVPPKNIEPKAIIVPHAGYIYSGFTANVAYNISKSEEYKTIVVIGPSHRYGFEGVSISSQEHYITPCGHINIDRKLSKELIEKNNFCKYIPEAHMEHSTETQALFIKAYFPKSKIIECVYGRESEDNIETLIEQILNKENTFLVISTDLSHFYNIEKANHLDKYCIEGIRNLDLDIWKKGCEACGRVGVKGLIKYSKKNNLITKILDYRTSFDITKDEKSVVGYLSVLVGKERK